MKNVSVSWLKIIATCLCLSGPLAAQTALPPVGGTEGAVQMSDGSASVRMSGDRSASISATPERVAQRPSYLPTPEMLIDDAPPFIEDAFYPQDNSVGFARTSTPDEIFWRVGRTNMDRYGVENTHTNINAMIPLSIESDKSLWFINPRINITDGGKGGANVGLGRRFYVPEEDRVYGASFWWDYDAGHAGTYNSLGGSFESIGRYFSLRSNFDIMVGDEAKLVSRSTGVSPRFAGSSIVLDQVITEERAYDEYDVEMTTPFPYLGDYGVDLGLGFYYLAAGQADDTAGFSVRTQAQVTEDFWINAVYTNDDVFDSNLSVNFEITMPSGKPTRWFRRKPVSDELMSSVRRRYRVPVHQSDRTTTRSLASTKGAGGDLNVAHIDPNLLTGGGDGSLAAPFMSIEEFDALPDGAQAAFDIVFVRRRDDGTDENLNTTLTLFDNQFLFGDGTLTDGSTHMFESDLGTFALPGTTAGALPLLTNSMADNTDVVRLANSNTVAGFQIDAGGSDPAVSTDDADGISGTGIDGFNINNNVFTNVVNGINITSDTSAALAGCLEDTGRIHNNVITAGGAGFDGISLTHTGGELALCVSDNTIGGFAGLDRPDIKGAPGPIVPPPGGFGGVGIDIRATGGTINANGIGIETGTPLADEFSIQNNTVNGNATGMRVIADLGAEVNVDIQSNEAQNNTDINGSGIEVIANGGTVNLETYISNNTSNNAGNGTLMAARSGGTLNVDSAPIIDIDPITAVVTTIDDPAVTLNTFDGNGVDGLRIEGDFGTVTVDQITGNTFNGNTDDGMEIATTTGGSVTITEPVFDNTFNGNGDNGLEVSTMGGDVSMSIGDPDAALPTTFNNNGANGIAFNLTGGTVTLDAIQNVTATGNGTNGLSIVNNEGGLFTTDTITMNNFSNNIGASMFIGGTGAGAPMVRAVTTLGDVTDNNFNRTATGTEGILFDSIDVFTSGTLLRNTFVGRAAGGRGIGGRIGGTLGVAPAGGLDFMLGSEDVADANTFTANTDAHIGLIFEGNTENDFRVDGHVFDSAVDGANVDFFGDGISLIARDTATLTGFVCRTDFTNNEGHGFSAQVTGNNAGMFAVIEDFNFGGHGLGNTVTGNGLNGVQVLRTADGTVRDFRIVDNVIDNNGGSAANQFTGNGIYLLSANAPTIDTFLIEDNDITNNALNGVLLDVRADGQMNVPIRRNNITGNSANPNAVAGDGGATSDFGGIHTIEQVTDATDLRGVTGPWQSNLIANNSGRGILLDAASGNTDPMDPLTTIPLLIGDETDPTLGNDIIDNGFDGIEMNGAGSVIIARNLIARNGVIGGFTVGNDNGMAAIDLNTNGFGDVMVLNNDITDNRGDGIEINADETLGLEFVINDNVIDFNDGRGLDVLAQAATNAFSSGSDTEITFNNNVVNANRLEGVYIVLSADATQTQSGLQPDDGGTTAGFGSGGNVFSDTHLVFNSDGNEILANGIDAEQASNPLITATGFVVYVGSTDTSTSRTFGGGFASDGFGGIEMSITNTNLSGNFGSDLFFRSFTSTVDPATSAGVWDAAMGFAPTGAYRSDPLSRLDLIYENVTFDGADVTNVGGFYNNAEGVFKSRTFDNMAPADGGPFGSATRQRNAQRQAARFALPPTNPMVGGATFLYSGLGDSTFRVRGDLMELDAAGFILDDFPPIDPSPIEDTFDANGIFRPGGGGPFGIDLMPYGWGTF